MTVQRSKFKCLTGAGLKIVAMACMFLDHAGWTVAFGAQWLGCVGRIAFPLFAFMVAEGYCHTRNFKRYLGRMFLFALISEIPFNLMTGGGLLNPFHQNVMFTFCLALLLLRVADKAWQRNWWEGLLVAVFAGCVGYGLGMLTFVDYNGCGILTVLAFWLARKLPRFGWAVQLAALAWINLELLGGMSYIVEFMGRELWVPQQAFALLALIPIWLYNGQRGPGGRKWQYFVYAFYPAHILILSLLALAGISL
ncbi:MAG: conjugal transfer protein TraX [Oscillospiraceae bacterium]|nr:conjugal transfer protein TraX [Oscillospiraceae bacterium]